MPLFRDRRTTVAILMSLAIFGWCIGAARSDTRRWVQNLHQGHQSSTFRQALDKLDQRFAPEKVDECTVCHEERNWAINLVATMAPVPQMSCVRCHRSSPEAKDSERGNALTSLGLPFLGTRMRRPTHEGVDLPGKLAGLTIGDPHIACSTCHPEHQGLDSAQRVKVDEANRLRITQECLKCHLPAEPSVEATAVLKDFMEAHKGDNAFDPKIPESAMKAIAEAREHEPLSPGVQKAAVRDVLDALAKQEFFGEADESRRGCTPACHGEHVPTSSDADEKKYNKPAEEEKKAAGGALGRFLAPIKG